MTGTYAIEQFPPAAVSLLPWNTPSLLGSPWNPALAVAFSLAVTVQEGDVNGDQALAPITSLLTDALSIGWSCLPVQSATLQANSMSTSDNLSIMFAWRLWCFTPYD